MARFYKATEGKQLDFMKELPVDLMVKAIQNVDAANDQIYGQTDLLGNAVAKVNHLSTDDARVKAIQDSYNAKIKETTDALMADPTNYRKQMPLVRNLARDISTDMQTGELAAIQGNANKLAEWDKTYKPMVAKGDITPEAYNSMKSSFLKNFAGTSYDATTGTYNQVSTEDIYKTQDLNKLIKENIDGIKANATGFKQTSDGGRWLITSGGKTEEVSAARIAQLATDSIMGDANVMGYLKQGGKYGYLRGIYDEEGKFINPYTTDKRGNPVFDERSFLARPIRAAVGREAFSKTESESTMGANPYAMAAENFGRDVQKIMLNDKIHDENFDREAKIKAQYNEQGIRLRADLSGQAADKKAKAKVPTTAKPKAVTKAEPKNPDPQLITSPDGEVAYSPFGGAKALNFKSIQGEFNAARDNTVKLLALSKNPNISENERATYFQRAQENQAIADKSADLIARAASVSNQKLKEKGYSDTEIKLIHEKYNSTSLKLSNELDELKKKTAIVSTGGMGMTGLYGTSLPKDYTQNMNRQIQVQKAYDRLKNGYTELMSGMNNYLKTNSDMTQTKLVGAGLNPSQKKLLMDTFKANPGAFVMRNPDNDEDENEVLNSEKFKEYQAKGGTINFHRVNAPAPGIGVTVAVDFKKSDGTANGNTKIMTIPYSVANALGESLIKDTNKTHKDIGSTIKDQFKSDFLSSIKNKVNDVVSGRKDQPAGFFPYYDPGTKTTTNIKVVPSTDKASPGGPPVSYKVYFSTPKGYIPLPISKDKSNEFPTEQAVADAFVEFARH